MAKLATLSKLKKSVAKSISTPVRNSAIPKVTAVRKTVSINLTDDMIAKKAFEIFASGKGGSEQDNWFAAERELNGSL